MKTFQQQFLALTTAARAIILTATDGKPFILFDGNKDELTKNSEFSAKAFEVSGTLEIQEDGNWLTYLVLSIHEGYRYVTLLHSAGIEEIYSVDSLPNGADLVLADLINRFKGEPNLKK